MQVETYEIEEIKNSEAATLAADGEAMELIERLGLKGQKELLSQDGNQTRFPYPAMTKLEALVFGTCFPEKTGVKEFAVEIIPLRVLQIMAYCENFSQVKHLEIWHPSVSKVDPILVGRSDKWSGTQYILARWGSALMPFAELVARARVIYQEKSKHKLLKLQSELDTKSKNLEYEILNAFETGDEISFSLYA